MSKQDIDYITQQKEEIEVLESIYLQDMLLLKSSPPFKFEVTCKPFTGPNDDISSDFFNLKIIVEFVKNYPDSNPKIQFIPITNISQDNIAEIESIAQRIIERANGSPIIYDIVESTRDWIHVNLIDLAIKLDDNKVDEDFYERPKYATFTPVTVENFNIWSAKFEAEMLEIKKHMKQDLDENNSKLTGKQWFVQMRHMEIENQQGQSGQADKKQGDEEGGEDDDDEENYDEDYDDDYEEQQGYDDNDIDYDDEDDDDQQEDKKINQ